MNRPDWLLLPWRRSNPGPAAVFDPVAERSLITESLLRSAARLIEHKEEAEIVRSVCEALTRITPHLRLTWTWFGDPHTPRIEPQIVAGPAAVYARALTIERNRLTQAGPAFRALAGESPGPFTVSPMSPYGPWREAARLHGIRSSLALPLQSDAGQHRGIFVLYADEKHYFEQVGVGLFDALAGLFSSVLSAAADRATLQREAHCDQLTGLSNRHALPLYEQQMRRSGPADPPGSVLLIDLDHFKAINDQHGHHGGDEVLRSVASRLRNTVRKGDGVLRWGGEEFLVCLPNTPQAAALGVAEDIRRQMASQAHEGKAGVSIALTVSIGVAELQPGQGLVDAVGQADLALYQSKRLGRNQVQVAALPAPAPTPPAGH